MRIVTGDSTARNRMRGGPVGRRWHHLKAVGTVPSVVTEDAERAWRPPLPR
ncbi:MAG: hypothetical protein AVDCRST_MAG70-1139 [uncultured Thermomicrobiales bacterium]|uniref:Uncharacterized protein n=1 Tax=uncultured Thermomicrobiales bacterium TaxID=1645740 RepID=A0A6J4ULE1_9BACT|nr:MAG: hypothetical protein AVDCRST_MAG70-1139 [uncultured Thermomicrobiales bacterium]